MGRLARDDQAVATNYNAIASTHVDEFGEIASAGIGRWADRRAPDNSSPSPFASLSRSGAAADTVTVSLNCAEC